MKEFQPFGYVAKGGGTTGANFTEINEGVYGEIARGDIPPPLILVCSAPGRILSDNTSDKITNHAIAASRYVRKRNIVDFEREFEKISQRYLGMLDEANIDGKGRRVVEEEIDLLHRNIRRGHAFEGTPEVIQALILAEFIPNSVFVDPYEVVAQNQDGTIDLEKTRKMTQAYFKDKRKDVTYIVPPHNALNPRGHVVELTRGSGDAVSGHMAGAVRLPCVIFTDTEGVLSADPRLVGEENVRKRPFLTFGELHSAALAGAQVVHIETIPPLEQTNGQLEIRHYRKSDQEGTIIVGRRKIPKKETPRVIAGSGGFQALFLKLPSNLHAEDYSAFGVNVSAALREMEVPIFRLHADFMGVDTIIKKETLSRKETRALREESGANLIETTKISLISIVGLGARDSADVTFKVGCVLADEKITPETFHTGNFKDSFVIGLHPNDFERAIRAFHRELIENVES